MPVYVLNILLLPLLSNSKHDNPTAYKLVAFVMRLITPLLQPTLLSFVENILIGSNTNFHEVEGEIVDEIYPLIFELHKISPKLLNGILPLLTVQLKIEEQEIRHKAVKLLGKLFLSETVDNIKDFPREFKEFLSRFNDLSTEIRLTMLDCSLLLLEKQESSIVEGMLFSL